MYFCLSCMTSREEETRNRVTSALEQNVSEPFLVWFPKKEVREKRRGQYEMVEKPLFSSYIFIYWEGVREVDFPFHELRRIPTVIRILGYDDGTRSLKGKDLGFAKWIHMHGGFIKQSKAVYREGQRVHILEGPLCGFDGNIVKVDRHHKRVTLRFEIGGTFSDVSFSVEFLDSSASSNALSSNRM